MNRVSPRTYANRSTGLLCAILIIQAVHICLIADTKLQDIIVGTGVAVVGLSLMLLLHRGISTKTCWPDIHVGLFLTIYIIAFCFVMVFSRMPYIVSYLELGLYGVRENSAVGGGGWYSIVTLIFYPLCIILAFVDIPRIQYYIYCVPMVIVVLVDFIFLGTRNAPVFVLLFHFLNLRIRFDSLRSISLYLVGSLAFVALFDYQSRGRSLDTVTVGWQWADTLRYSWLMEHLPIKEHVIRFLDTYFSLILPAVFLMQYISHSLAVFSSLIVNGQFDLIGNFPYLLDQYCVVANCDREMVAGMILDANPDAGLYQTIYSSLLFDLGWVGLGFVLVIFLSVSLFSSSSGIYVSGAAIYFSMILATSSIENYLYNGLGLWRGLAFILLVWVLSRIPVGDSEKIKNDIDVFVRS